MNKKYIDKHGVIDVSGLMEAARIKGEEKQERQSAELKEYLGSLGRDADMENLLRKFAESESNRRVGEAQIRIEEEQKKSNEEIETRINKELNVDQDKTPEYKAYSKLVQSLDKEDGKLFK